ncbi:MAG: UvrB/UvrC motif-containing protein [Phycisphaerales bacterium]|nr:MAG: UvrB/UvrC motif-containing protein [Phycisphaerales bacterium]
MSYIDLKPTLAEWPYDAEQVSVRKILGADEGIRIQMRVELGVLQMEAEGRPDSQKPCGCESLVEYHRKRLARHEDANGTSLGFVLSPQQCQELRFEASLYYRRYVALFVLEEYTNVAKDTSHNLKIFDLCRDFALEPEDRTCLEPFRPYVLMMDARARAHDAIEQREYASALAHVNRGIMSIKDCYENQGQSEAMENSEELKMLRGLAMEINEQMPQDSLLTARKALRAAIEQERFEEAARLRDEIDKLSEQKEG